MCFKRGAYFQNQLEAFFKIFNKKTNERFKFYSTIHHISYKIKIKWCIHLYIVNILLM